jgi:hypothetical protein
MNRHHQMVYLAVDFHRERIVAIGQTAGQLNQQIISQFQNSVLWVYQTRRGELDYIRRLMNQYHLAFHEVTCRVLGGYGNGTVFAA